MNLDIPRYSKYLILHLLPAKQHSSIELPLLWINDKEKQQKACTVEFLKIWIMKTTFINQLKKEIHLHSSSQDINGEVDDVELVEEGQ